MDYLGKEMDAKKNEGTESADNRFVQAFGNHSYSSVTAGVCEKHYYSAVSEKARIQLTVPFTNSTEASITSNKRERKLNRRLIIISSVIVVFVLGCLIAVAVYFVTKGSSVEVLKTNYLKASTTEVTTAVDLYASTTEVSTADDIKASTNEVTTAVDFKASTTKVFTDEFKASTTEVTTAVDFKVQCPNNYTKSESETCGKFCYRYESNQCQSWFDARQICQNEGGDLMVPSECSYQFFREQAPLNEGSCSQFWIGGRTETPGYNYVTVKGDVIPQDSSFSYWSIGQPDGLGGESCLEMRMNFNSYLMNDYHCFVKEGFICQFFLK